MSCCSDDAFTVSLQTAYFGTMIKKYIIQRVSCKITKYKGYNFTQRTHRNLKLFQFAKKKRHFPMVKTIARAYEIYEFYVIFNVQFTLILRFITHKSAFNAQLISGNRGNQGCAIDVDI